MHTYKMQWSLGKTCFEQSQSFGLHHKLCKLGLSILSANVWTVEHNEFNYKRRNQPIKNQNKGDFFSSSNCSNIIS